MDRWTGPMIMIHAWIMDGSARHGTAGPSSKQFSTRPRWTTYRTDGVILFVFIYLFIIMRAESIL
jgi:hypothetical protein